MSIAKQIIIENFSNISDDIQDEFEVMENLYFYNARFIIK